MRTPEELAVAVFEALNAGQLDRIRDLVTEDFVDHGMPPGVVPPGPDGYIAVLSFVTGTLETHYELHDIVAAGEMVAIRATGHGKHCSDMLGVPATGKTYAMPTMHLFKARDGRLAEHWGVRDEWSVLVQVGALVPKLPELTLP